MDSGGEQAAEAQLVDSARAGDAASFEILFDRYYAMIHVFAYRVTLTATEADDVAQETFIRAARGLAGFRGEASFKNWLYRIAHRVLADFIRASSRRDQHYTGLASEAQIRDGERLADFNPIHEALRRLPREWREAVGLVFFDEMNHAQAARVLGCAESTVSWRIFRAKRALRRLLEKEVLG